MKNNDIKLLKNNLNKGIKTSLLTLLILILVCLLISYPQFFFFITFGIIGIKKVYFSKIKKEQVFFKSHQKQMKGKRQIEPSSKE